MTILKILLVIVAVQLHEGNSNPLFQGISFQRGFEINFKPLPRKPITFMKEKWSPFGVFGKKFGIHKRSLDDMVPPVKHPRPAAPVFEEIEELEPIDNAPLLILPKPVKPVVPEPAPVAVKPPPPPLAPVAAPKPPPPLPVPMPIIVGELPPKPVIVPSPKPDAIPAISTNMVIIQPTKVVNNHVSTRELYTDISRVEAVKEHINAGKPPPPPHEPKPVVAPPPPVAPVPPPPKPIPPPAAPAPLPPKPVPPPVAPVPSPPPPPKPPVPEPPHPVPIKEEKKEELPPPPPEEKTEILFKDSPIVRGSKMALQFGTVFLSLMAQFLDGARASLDQMTNPPPKFIK